MRSPEFNEDSAIESIMLVFWKKGYVLTSIKDLVDASGVNSRSMYKLLGNKEALFERALDHYALTVGRETSAILQPANGVAAIEAFLKQFSFEDNYPGSFMVNAAVQEDFISAAALEKVAHYFKNIESLFYQCLKVSQDRGEINATLNIKNYATLLLCNVQGMSVIGKMRKRNSDAKAIIKSLIHTIKI